MPLFNSPELRERGFYLALAAFCLAGLVVILGAFTRLVDAGLGCPDWPGCYGHLLWPNNSEEIANAQQLFPESPVESDKTWPEMVHRYFAGTLGLFIVALAIMAWKQRERSDYPFRLPMLLLFLVVWQALFGMWTVTLKLWPQVVTLHLLGGVSIFNLLWLLCLRLNNQPWVCSEDLIDKLSRLKVLVVLGIIIVFCQIALGGWISSNYAAFACPDFPSCDGQWWPPANFAEGFNLLQTVGPNYLGGLMTSEARVAIHLTHRVGALLATVFLLLLSAALISQEQRECRRMAWFILAALAGQIGLGVANVVFNIPLAIAVAHNAGGAILLATLVTLGYKLWTVKTSDI